MVEPQNENTRHRLTVIIRGHNLCSSKVGCGGVACQVELDSMAPIFCPVEFHGVRHVEPASPTDKNSANSLCKQTKSLRSLPQVTESLPVTRAKLQSVMCSSYSSHIWIRQVPSSYRSSCLCTSLPFSVPHFLFFYSCMRFLFLAFRFLFINTIKPWKYPGTSSGPRAAQFTASL